MFCGMTISWHCENDCNSHLGFFLCLHYEDIVCNPLDEIYVNIVQILHEISQFNMSSMEKGSLLLVLLPTSVDFLLTARFNGVSFFDEFKSGVLEKICNTLGR